ncbi:glycoside hydrolase [Achlya hypogyna]|uniref:glucan endo-1,3-beta-D-glucosidase n=1 Tax=Achlya hypogyna TaxID=1202772 RepID=A0A0A7CPI5_ACHHY|nr:secreted protein [Achlya hypogyna]OQR80966.1 glycoside hydrolase [Achlya hypogyna]
MLSKIIVVAAALIANVAAMGVCYDTYDFKNIDRHFDIIHQRFQTVRTFQTYIYGSRNVIDAASDHGLGIYAGVWIRGPDYYNDIQAIIDGYYRHPHALKAVFVGNEDLDNGWNVQQVIDKVNEVRNRLRAANIQVRVGSVQTDGGWLNNPRLADACDIMGVNIYSFFGGALEPRWNAMVSRFGGSKLMITETGWPFNGGNYGGNVASYWNAVNHFNQVASWYSAGNGGEDVMYFMYHDNSGKWPEYEKHFGLADNNGNWKFDFAVPARGSCSQPEWNTDYPGNDMFNFPISGDMNSLISQCCSKCVSTPGCGGYSIFEDRCYIKSAMTGRKDGAGVTSARRQ